MPVLLISQELQNKNGVFAILIKKKIIPVSLVLYISYVFYFANICVDVYKKIKPLVYYINQAQKFINCGSIYIIFTF